MNEVAKKSEFRLIPVKNSMWAPAADAMWNVHCIASLAALIATPYDATHGMWKTKTVFFFTLTNIINSRLRNQYVLSPPSISPETFAYGSLPIPPSSIKLSCFFLIRKRHVPT